MPIRYYDSSRIIIVLIRRLPGLLMGGEGRARRITHELYSQRGMKIGNLLLPGDHPHL
jgi:hypothetical protein